MNKSKCPVCGSCHTVKNGKRNGTQTYRCAVCGYQFRNEKLPSVNEIWQLYSKHKQTVSELAKTLCVSESTIKRRLREVEIEWNQPSLSGSGFVHLDATYWGRGHGILLAIDEASGIPLYLAMITNETTADYVAAVSSIENRGYAIKGIIIDGKKSLFTQFSGYSIQMCQFHMKQIVRRYITQHPRLKAAIALKRIVDSLACANKDNFCSAYQQWKSDWHATITRRTTLSSGKTRYTHRRLRSAMHSLDFYLPYLFTYQAESCAGMPNTNNKIEGIFTSLKTKMNAHNGMSDKNRQRFIFGFFLALASSKHDRKDPP